MGPAAEPTATRMLDHQDRKARRDACLALVVIGSKACQPKLRELIERRDSAHKYAERAREAIAERLAGAPP